MIPFFASFAGNPGPTSVETDARFRVRLAIVGGLHSTAYGNLHGHLASAES